MLRIRAFEDAAERASEGGVSAFGQNTVDAAMATPVAKGVDTVRMMCELYGRASGSNGKGGSVKPVGLPRIPVGYAPTLEGVARVRPAAIVDAALTLLR